MKKYIVLLLALALVLCAGCGKQEPVQTEAPATIATEPVETTEATVPPTTEETIPVPELSMGSALVDDTPAILGTLMQDDVVDVVGEYDEDHYVIKTELGYGLVKKGFLQPENEAPYETWTGYSHWDAKVYDNFYLTGEPILTLYTNAKAEVLADLGYCYMIRTGETEGFISKSQLATRPFSGGGGGGGGADGGDISLRFQGGIIPLVAIEQKGDVTGQALVLADGTEVVLGYFDRGDEIPMVAEDGFAETREGYVTVYLDGLYAYVPQELVAEAGAEAYAEWDGYSFWNAVVYDNRHLLGDPVIYLQTNTAVHVIAELEDCYLVEVNGVTGYMLQSAVSKTRISSGGGGGGAEWSPPAL